MSHPSQDGTFVHPSPQGRTFPDWEGSTEEAGKQLPLGVPRDLQPGLIQPRKRMAGS